MRLGLHSLGGDGGTLRRNADGPAGNCRRGRRIQDIYRSSPPSCRENLESVQSSPAPRRSDRRSNHSPSSPATIWGPPPSATATARNFWSSASKSRRPHGTSSYDPGWSAAGVITTHLHTAGSQRVLYR